MTIHRIITDCAITLKSAGIESYSLDAEILAAHVLKIERFRIPAIKDDIFPENLMDQFKALCERRSEGEPVAYLLNRKEFYSLDFYVDKNVLIPRPETELIIDLAIYYAPMNGMVLDLCTGSGAIAVSLKHTRKDLAVYASDISENAISVAKRNSSSILKDSSIEFITCDLFSGMQGIVFDVIVTNPPYIGTDEKGELAKDLFFEPEEALFSGNDGTLLIKRIMREASQYLKKNGTILMEINSKRRDLIVEMAASNNFNVSIVNDYSSLPRIAVVKKAY